MVDKSVYNVILSQVFSPCRHLFVAGNIYGEIGIYLMKEIFLPKTDNIETEKRPKRIFQTPNNEKVCSLAASKKFLIAGTVGEIFAWEWALLPKRDLKISWNISVPCQRDSYVKPDINSLLVNEDSCSFLYAGCGDNRVYMFSLEDGREIRAFENHTDYIHSISFNGKELASASEDGEVKLWDSRQARVISSLCPSSNENLARPDLGVWIGDVSINSNKLVCGGGPKGSIWDLNKLKDGRPFEVLDKGVHVCKLFSDHVVIGGIVNGICVFDTEGDLLVKLPSSASVNYIALAIDHPSQILVYGGASNYIDICRNYKSRCHILTFG